jgi:CO/xanthine dehydrogenase Mo-binding subunit
VTKTYVGQRIKRTEDPLLLTGQAQFVGDVEIPGMLYAAFLRSDYAHARLRSIDVSAARDRPGVVAVYTAEDMGEDWKHAPPLVSPPPTIEDIVFHSRTQVPLVKNKVRHAGEPLAMVLAESRYMAEDALEHIWAELEPLPAVVDMEAALEPNAPLVHEDLESNLAAHLVQEKGDYAAARQQADLVLRRRIVIDRCAAAAMENGGSWPTGIPRADT